MSWNVKVGQRVYHSHTVICILVLAFQIYFEMRGGRTYFDFGMERGTEYALEQIYNIIDSRYRSRKPLIVTTNLTLTELKNPQDTAHARIYDRLLELCTPIACTGPSMRKDIGQAKLNLLKTLLA